MAESDKNKMEATPGFDPSIQTEKLAFDAGQMVECGSCRRSKPPNRLGCLYCGSMLEMEMLDPIAVRPGFRKLDPWERGYNLVSKPRADPEITDFSQAASVLSIAEADLQAILRSPVPVPLCRVENEAEAASVHKVLAKIGIESSVVSDLELAADKPPIRLAGIEISESDVTMITFNSRREIGIALAEIVLLVEGIISVSSIDQVEKRKLGGRSQPLGDVSTVSDEPLLDIYSSADTVGYRVQTTGFDFSCLGNEKGLLAADNLKKLENRLTAVCFNSKFVTEYRLLRPTLGSVWEVEMRRDPKGLQRTGFGKREFGAVTSTSNLDQFTKFSRLQRLLYENQTQ